MLFKSALVSTASGSIGGMTASRNRGGQYFRSRAIPVNPNTTAQIAARNALTASSIIWGTLTDAQRTAWNLYASNVPTTNKLGDSIFLSGQQWFVAMNTLRQRAGQSLVTAAPTTFQMADLTLPTLVSPSAASGNLEVNFTTTDDWANEIGGGLFVQMGRPQCCGVSFFKGPWQKAGTIDGNTTPPTSPDTLTAPFPMAVGNKIWIRCTAFLADGRISPPIIVGPETAV